VLVAQESALDHVEVVDPVLPDLLTEETEHDRRDIDRDHPAAEWRDGHGERPRAGPEINDRVRVVQPEVPQQLDIFRGIGAGFPVIPRHVLGIEVLAPGMGKFIRHPGWHVHDLSVPSRRIMRGRM
jgi:hypothetical protein